MRRLARKTAYIFQAKAGEPESDEADVLSLLIKNYEEVHYPKSKACT